MRLLSYAPEAYASTNSATWALYEYTIALTMLFCVGIALLCAAVGDDRVYTVDKYG